MNQISWNLALAVFVGTVPLLGAVLWNLMSVQNIKAELLQIRIELTQIRIDLGKLTERVAILEERDRNKQSNLVKN